MQLKVELGFINAISCLFEEEEILDENTGEKLNKDLELARKPLQVVIYLLIGLTIFM